MIESKDNKKIKQLKKLLTKKGREEEKCFLIEGEHLILEAKKHGCLKEIFSSVPCQFENVTYISDKIMKYITMLDSPPKMIGVASMLKEEVIGDKILILDGIQDPGNLGTIIRSSVGFHIDTIILSKDTVDLYNPKVIRSTQGLLFSIHHKRCDLPSILDKLKKDNYFIYGTKVNGGNDLKTIEKKKKFAIIMGNEGKGMSASLENVCDSLLTISTSSKLESLNVGVACSIILYELDKE